MLQINNIDYVEFYVGNASQAAHFYRMAFGFTPIAFSSLETGERDRTSFVLQQNNITLLSPVRSCLVAQWPSMSAFMGTALRTSPSTLMMSDTLLRRRCGAYLDTAQLPGQIDILRTQYGLRRDVMMRALAENFPDAARWTKPECGFFAWVELPPVVDVDELFRRAIEDEHVAFIPGHAFSVNMKRWDTSSIRLNFSHPTTAQIEEGIPRLARVLKSLLG